MNQDASVVIAITARNQATETLRQVKQGTSDVGQQMESTRTTARSTSGVFGGLGRQLVGMAAGFVGVATITQGVIKGMEDITKATASARATAEIYGPSALRALELVEAQAITLAMQFYTTESAVLDVFSTLLRESRNPQAALAKLDDTMAIANFHGREFQETAQAMAYAIRQNGDPMRALIGDFGDLDTVAKRALERQEEAISFPRRLGAGIAQIRELLGRGQIYAAMMHPIISPVNEVNLNVSGNVVMNEDQEQSFIDRIQELLDRAHRGRP